MFRTAQPHNGSNQHLSGQRLMRPPHDLGQEQTIGHQRQMPPMLLQRGDGDQHRRLGRKSVNRGPGHFRELHRRVPSPKHTERRFQRYRSGASDASRLAESTHAETWRRADAVRESSGRGSRGFYRRCGFRIFRVSASQCLRVPVSPHRVLPWPRPGSRPPPRESTIRGPSLVPVPGGLKTRMQPPSAGISATSPETARPGVNGSPTWALAEKISVAAAG